MIRVLLFVALLFVLAMGFAWMADLPGVVSVSWDGYVWEQTPVVAAVVVVVLLVLFLLAVWLISTVLRSPKIANRFFRRRRKDKGYQALSHGLIALGTGNAKLARRYGLDAEKLLKGEPAAKLLIAQAAQLAGKEEEARSRFEAMLEDPETRALGLHGLFIEAERHEEPIAARHYAEEAAKTQPGLEWAGKAVLGYQAIANHWDQALVTLERNYSAKLIDKKTYRRHRAVIMTALAGQLEDQEPERAFSLSKEAHGLAPDLVPAALVSARLATRKGDTRKAAKLIETTWRLSPHPDLAEAYAHVRPGDSAMDRLKRVKHLAGQRTGTTAGTLAWARAAIEAREFGEAREQLKKILREEPSRSAFLLMAELEETEHGDQGRMRDWLSRALRAPLDKAWVADGVATQEWQAVSPVTGQLDAFVWTTPSRLPDQEDGPVIEDSLFEAPVISMQPEVDPASANMGEKAEEVERDAVAEMKVVNPAPPPSAGKEVPIESDVETAQDVPPPSPAKHGYEGTTDDVRHAPSMKNLPDAPAETQAGGGGTAEKSEKKTDKSTPTRVSSASEDGQSVSGAASRENASELGKPADDVDKEDNIEGVGSDSGKGEAGAATDKTTDVAEGTSSEPIAFPFKRMPDDPGPLDDDDQPAKPRQSGFFK
ncbi:heme biosynthesis protein HemY [Roseibium sp. RKSG952]|uniref:heme biosynthesis protein HemY n=1 Tax=Roseibium sp. RKSG952 TaxID=2529384 RepID=UPI0012BB9E48|nr:heme biosynthesis HemY N-terminal domain-containing protein [Roseibium sp. RKSG952]MTH99294.1 heme biosynthesis protein HemY [Roseibium sp. RKSG952]